MAATPEAKVKAAVRKILDAYAPAVYYFFPPANGYGRTGIPDVIACVNGKFLAIECKAGANTTTALQNREIAAIRAAGGRAFVVNEHNFHDVETVVKLLMES